MLTTTGFVKSTRSMAVALAAPQRPGVSFPDTPGKCRWVFQGQKRNCFVNREIPLKQNLNMSNLMKPVNGGRNVSRNHTNQEMFQDRNGHHVTPYTSPVKTNFFRK